ncbi:MAG: inorganic pyrophosphatase [Candidatus Pacebacteria bacterium]|nr:inorganic pyrophosphatase [Candidatus Paceibacterota bacterium]
MNKENQELKESKSLEISRQFLGEFVEVAMDRPMGSKHPKHDFIYEANYGYIEGVEAPDGEDLDAYYFGTTESLSRAKGVVIAVIHRLENDDDKLVVVPEGIDMTDEEIDKAVNFQEKWFKHEIVRK